MKWSGFGVEVCGVEENNLTHSKLPPLPFDNREWGRRWRILHQNRLCDRD